MNRRACTKIGLKEELAECKRLLTGTKAPRYTGAKMCRSQKQVSWWKQGVWSQRNFFLAALNGDFQLVKGTARGARDISDNWIDYWNALEKKGKKQRRRYNFAAVLKSQAAYF